MRAAGPAILHVIPHDGVGGVEVAARSMLERHDLTCDFRLLLIAGVTLSPDKAKVFESPFRSPLNPLAQLRALRIAMRYRPDVVLVSLWRSVPVALLLRLLLRRTKIVFFLNLERPAHIVDRALSWLARLVADEIWADSSRTLQARLKGSKKRARVISFVTERICPPAGPGGRPEPEFVCWCRLSAQKGLDRAVRFIAALRSRHVDARLTVWGPDDGELPRLREEVGRLGLREQITFPGPVARSELAKAAAAGSFFLLLSHSEGMAMGVVEAMQLGLVPVVTPVGEIGTYVRDGQTGIIVDPEHPEPALAAIERLLADERAYRRMRQQAMDVWSAAPIYAEDVCRGAEEMLSLAEDR